MKKEVYRVRVALVFLLIILIMLPGFSNATHKPGHVPGAEEEAADTTTTTGGGGGGPAPITVSIESPEDGETLKREILTIVVKGYRGINPETDMIVTATSDLFGEIGLANNFEQRGSGIYGANVTISKEVKKENYVLLVRGRRGSAVDERQILVTLDPTITVD